MYEDINLCEEIIKSNKILDEIETKLERLL